ncbi:hypothetical protein QQM39_39415 [Streptomyces sp. DT2A-34]|uniref:hypothetical protein n=1 Tax=Streptomyces sp. DT2A-34 TaxID=3051182 RepID=UPI00265BD085|nr:hypothetical protein [Streptomyces sp. DT2A-34]MDO0916672.1 hypothetical protein [Streptomyces sp. DT2A-34]
MPRPPEEFVVFRRMIPNVVRLVATPFLFGQKLVTVGSPPCPGLGMRPPDSDRGAMILDAQSPMEGAAWIGILPIPRKSSPPSAVP